MGRRQRCTPVGSPCWLCPIRLTAVISGRGRENETRRFDNDTFACSAFVSIYTLRTSADLQFSAHQQCAPRVCHQPLSLRIPHNPTIFFCLNVNNYLLVLLYAACLFEGELHLTDLSYLHDN